MLQNAVIYLPMLLTNADYMNCQTETSIWQHSMALSPPIWVWRTPSDQNKHAISVAATAGAIVRRCVRDVTLRPAMCAVKNVRRK